MVRRARLPRRWALFGLVIGVSILAAGGLVLARNDPRPLSFEELAQDAATVPVPEGVHFLSEGHMTNHGPGFSSQISEQVSRTYGNSLPCGVLEQRWQSALTAAHRQFRIHREPYLYVATGQVEIVVTDRPENLGITLGGITNQGAYIGCSGPFIWAFNHLH